MTKGHKRAKKPPRRIGSLRSPPPARHARGQQKSPEPVRAFVTIFYRRAGRCAEREKQLKT
ncbi:hypothetical protein DPQ25_07905 [Hydrogeniiclostridium mannosilyticum]|uniref:Uncharacterized protein n=1 Tax=Hydrogeniiclostridium mannosilyticum TaxID=2764322 RepID=A0A328UBI8_9FIRM|nr:hypothetical protein DPQ25_07905 [Hydrogeniiclostridium mannosilyticum]